MRYVALLLMTMCLLAHAAVATEERQDPRSTPFGTVVYGTAIGAVTGLAAGWVRYADLYQMQDVWDSVGYGALAGVGVGTVAAVLGPEGKGYRVLKDVDTLSSAGGGIGFTWGLISALFTGSSPRIANGMAWGHLAGFVAGTGLAIYKIAEGQYDMPDDDGKLLSVELLEDSAAHPCAVLTYKKSF